MNADRQLLLSFFKAGVDAVKGRRVVATHLRNKPVAGVVYLIAIGKAGASMVRGAYDVLGGQIKSGLLITKYGHVSAEVEALPRLTIIESAHPVPDEQSLLAGEALLEFIKNTPADAQLLFLISGGASSLVECPVDGVGFKELRRINQWLLGSGLDIAQMNAVRKAVSIIKGGRLAHFIGRRMANCLLISDVPGDKLSIIGSGMLVLDSASEMLPDLLPDWIQYLLRQSSAPPAASAPVWAQIKNNLVATLSIAIDGIESKARDDGLAVFKHRCFLDGSTVVEAKNIATYLLDAPQGLHIWGGETTVQLGETPGRGGRNQHLALAAAHFIKGQKKLLVLCAGTDGTDGPTNDAGGLVDGGTIDRGKNKGEDCAIALSNFNAGQFLVASDDLVTTGPTGTNVMDVVLGLKI